jgi:hypothetical protein
MCPPIRALGRLNAGQSADELSYACLWNLLRFIEETRTLLHLEPVIRDAIQRRASEYSGA